MATNQFNDPFLDDQFGGVDLRPDPDNFKSALADIGNENPEFAPPAEDELPADPAAVSEPEPVAAPGPQVTELRGGGTLTVEKGDKGWKATLDSGTGAPVEVFYGRTKDEMYQNVAEGKINATKKIREMTRREKLGIGAPEPAKPSPAPVPVSAGRELTADEKFELKTLLQSDPDLAFNKWFQKKTGYTAEQLVSLAQDGREARAELDTEAVAKEFLSAYPEYYCLDSNYEAIVSYLSKNKLGRQLTESNRDQIMLALHDGGHWTVKNLGQAFEDLTASGLLEAKPAEEEIEEETPAPAPAAAAPAPAPAAPAPDNARIVRQTRRPRAGLGIRASETSTSAPAVDANRPPSVEELDNASDEDIAQAFAAVRRHKLQTTRR